MLLMPGTVPPGRRSCPAGAGGKQEPQKLLERPLQQPKQREKYPGIFHKHFPTGRSGQEPFVTGAWGLWFPALQRDKKDWRKTLRANKEIP